MPETLSYQFSLNCPIGADVRHALDVDHYRMLSEAWIRVRDDTQVRCAIVTGAGDKAFCAGADIKSFIGREEPLHELWQTQRDQILNRVSVVRVFGTDGRLS